MRRLITIAVLALASALCTWGQYDRDVFYYRGRQALSDGKFSEAISNFNILARLDTTDYWTFFFRGIAKYNLGDVRGAYNDFDRSVRINPVFTNGYHYRGITQSRFSHYDEALADIQKAMDLRPSLEGLYFSRGVTYFLAQQFDKSVEDFNVYIKKEPKDPAAYLNRGAAKLFLKDTVKALEDYNKAIKLDPFEPEGYVRRGRVYALKKDYKEAIADMDQAVKLDSTNTFAFFNRALMYYELKDYNSAMADLNRVLREEPGNALTLYNRSLILAQVGDFEAALEDMDRVININPNNVLAYYNRASYFVQMERWLDALDDYDKAISLYPDFAKAYMNRSYVKNMMGMLKSSKQDYEIARQKVQEYRAKNAAAEGSFADTTKKYNSLLSLDADFAKKDFDNELLQHRDIDIRLRPLYKFRLTKVKDNTRYALSRKYENILIDKFISESPVPVVISNADSVATLSVNSLDAALYGDSRTSAGDPNAVSSAEKLFLRGLYDLQNKQYSSALNYFNFALSQADSTSLDGYYKAFYYMNRGVLRAEMIDFISSIESNVQTLTMDDKGTTRARVTDQVTRTYDYSDAIADMILSARIVGDIPYTYFNLGNLNCLSSNLVDAIQNYDRAISLWPGFADAYFNRGLVLIYLKDKEKGCIDLSRAGELGVPDSYSVIHKYCEEDSNR